MAKKKKQGEQARQKILQAQHRNDYMRKLKHICSLINPDVPLFDLIPVAERLSMYEFRGASVKAVASPGSKVPHAMLAEMEMVFKKISATKQVELTEGTGTYVSISDFWLIVFPLEVFVKNGLAGQEYYADFLKDRRRIDRYLDKALLIKSGMEMYCCDMGKCLYSVRCDFNERNPDRHDYRGQMTLVVTSFEPEKRQIIVDGNLRTAFRVAWLHEESFLYLSVLAAKLHTNSRFPKLRIPVYIQQHAIDRLEERIFIPWRGMMFVELTYAILKAEISRTPTGDFLITYFLMGKKAGYLLASMIDGILLIRTFLFLTNNGTPEGKKLEQFTGLQKLDREYLNIDRLDTLVGSDILNNKEVCDLFRKAGCQSLLELCEKIQNDSVSQELLPEKQTALASRIAEYLKAAKDTPEDTDIAE